MGDDTKVALKIKIGYGIASLGDTAIYNLLIVYTLFFLTDVVQVSPLIAGVIIFTASVWNAVFIGIIGYVSDKSSFTNNRRLPYMKRAILPIIVFTVLMFTAVGGPHWFKVIYYMVINGAVWTMHSMYVVPYEALGAEIRQDSKGRTELRTYARFFMTIGNICGMVIVLKLVELFEQHGHDVHTAWQDTVFLIAVVSGLSFALTCFILSKEKNGSVRAAPKKRQERNILREYLQVIRLKPFMILLSVTLLFTAANIFFSSDVLYFMKYNLGLPEDQKVIVFLMMTLSGLVMTPVYSVLAKRFDKKYVMQGAFIAAGIGMYLFAFYGLTSFSLLCVYVGIFTIGSSAYWQLMYSLVYDISEFDEWTHKKRREGIIMSSSKIFLRISTAASVQLLAAVLYLFDYDAGLKIQHSEALKGIELALTYIPATLFILAAILIFFYPLSNEKHKELVGSLKNLPE